MKRERFIALMMSLIVTTGLLAGCGDNKADDTEAVDQAVGETEQAEVQNDNAGSNEIETITIWTDSNTDKVGREEQIREFNANEGKELGIEINYQVYGQKYVDTLRIAAQAGETPEIFRSDDKWLAEFVDAGWVLPYEDLPGSEELLSRYDGMLSDQKQVFDGKTYTLPYSMTTYGFVINMDLFRQAGLTDDDIPETWDEVREVAAKITEAAGGKAYGLGLSSTLWTVSSYYTFGAGENVGHYGYNWDEKKFEYSAFNPLIKAIDQMVADGSVFPGFESLDADAIRAQFAAGTIGMMGMASFDCSAYQETFPVNFEWKITGVPKFSEEQPQYKRFGLPTNLICVGPNAMKHPEKVMKVVEFLYDDKNLAEMYEEGVYIPLREEAIALATKEPTLRGFAEYATFDELFVMPPVPDAYVAVEGTTYREAITNMWTNPELDDVDAIMEDVDKRYNEALEKVDPAIIDLYVIPDGESPIKGE